jgi:hypothetical protein
VSVNTLNGLAASAVADCDAGADRVQPSARTVEAPKATIAMVQSIDRMRSPCALDFLTRRQRASLYSTGRVRFGDQMAYLRYRTLELVVRSFRIVASRWLVIPAIVSCSALLACSDDPVAPLPVRETAVAVTYCDVLCPNGADVGRVPRRGWELDAGAA